MHPYFFAKKLAQEQFLSDLCTMEMRPWQSWKPMLNKVAVLGLIGMYCAVERGNCSCANYYKSQNKMGCTFGTLTRVAVLAGRFICPF